MRSLGGLALVLALLAVGLAAYARIGWSRMESACTADGPSGQSWGSVETSWSWKPVGFRCTYDDGRTLTSLRF